MRRAENIALHLCFCAAIFVISGCTGRDVRIPAGHFPRTSHHLDAQTSLALTSAPTGQHAAGEAPPPMPKSSFDLPRQLPGLERGGITPPRFERGTPIETREAAVQEAYPRLVAAATSLPSSSEAPLSLADLQQMALESSPVIRKAVADADAVYGQVIQAGLHPNPTLGYQADQWQPGPRPKPINNNGQQGGFINQLIKTAGKLTLAQRVAGFDYINALVAVRKAQVEVMAEVRANYFAALVAQQSMDVNKSLSDLADQVYRLQLKQVAVGEAAGYEPLQLYAQAIQSRNALVQAENSYRAAWAQLAASIGQPQMPIAPLAGRADAEAPAFDWDQLLSQLLDQHTDVLTARNKIAQAQQNIFLQRRIPIPDLEFNNYHQYDNVTQLYQFGVQLGISLPISDRNQGNIRSAMADLSSASQQLMATENRLTGRFAEAVARYRTNSTIAASYREKVLPSLTQAYQMLIRRWNADEPGKVSFNDIVVAQQNLAQALQAYLGAVGGQWQAVVDVANIAQLDELYVDVPQPTPAGQAGVAPD